MNRTTLATRLIAARSRRERSNLLDRNAAIVDQQLALVIKDICYASWTVKPTTARGAAAAMDNVAERIPSPQIEAVSLWVTGIAEITRGRLESAAANLDAASRKFRSVGEQRESAKPMVAALIAYAMLGRYDEAVATAKRAVRIFTKFGDELEAGKIDLNLSNIFARQGLHSRAEKYGLSALARFSAAGAATWRTMAENDLANTYAELNDFNSAEHYYTLALQHAAELEMAVTQAEIEASMGNLAVIRGNYAEALRYLESSRSKYDDLGMRHQSVIADLEIAGIYSGLNLLKEALALYRRAAAAFRRLKTRGEEARARAEMGRAALAFGELKLADRELIKAERLYLAEGNRTGRSNVLLTMVRSNIQAGRLTQAAHGLERARTAIGRDKRLALAADLLDTEIRTAAGDRAGALRKLKRIVNEGRRLEQPEIVQEAFNRLGKIASSSGRDGDAELYFRKAIEMIEGLRSPLPADEFRVAFLAARLEPYENLTRLLIQDLRFEEAFNSVEQARSRALVDAMLEISGTADGPDHEKAAALRRELNWWYSRSSRAEPSELTKITSEIRKREKMLSDILRRLGSSARSGPRASQRNNNTAQAVRRRVGTTVAFVEYIEAGGSLSAFCITNDGVEFFPGLVSPSEIADLLSRLRFQFDSLRYEPSTLAKFQSQLKTRADKYLEKLYEKLLKPIAPSIGPRDLVIAPVSILNHVPFHALRNAGSYVVEEREVVTTPGAEVWLRLKAERSAPAQNALFMAFADDLIPNAEIEADTLKRIFPKSRIRKGKNATFAAYQTEAPEFDIVHLACHGQFRPDDAAYSALHLADGWVTVKDVCSQRLRASLVTLSACETGLSEIIKGDELMGLARGFLTAGAKSLVLTLWTVNDESATQLMKIFYKNLQRGGSVAASLSIAQRKLISSGAHPYFWSPFLVVGR